MLFLLRCPRCKNQMKYAAKGSILGKRKSCVYCNFSMDVRKSVLQQI